MADTKPASIQNWIDRAARDLHKAGVTIREITDLSKVGDLNLEDLYQIMKPYHDRLLRNLSTGTTSSVEALMHEMRLAGIESPSMSCYQAEGTDGKVYWGLSLYERSKFIQSFTDPDSIETCLRLAIADYARLNHSKGKL